MTDRALVVLSYWVPSFQAPVHGALVSELAAQGSSSPELSVGPDGFGSKQELP